MFSLIYPRKCVLCTQILCKDEIYLCKHCRENAPVFRHAKRNIPFIAQWTALWYYKENVRRGMRRFKFYSRRHYAKSYGALLASLIEARFKEGFDVLSWIPVSPQRYLQRGFDQSALITKHIARQLGIPKVRVLRKVRHTKPQSLIKEPHARRANVTNAYKVVKPDRLKGKRILLIDDVITTGATVSECAKTLSKVGVKEVYFAAVAAAEQSR